jgi:hypothetical protein
MVEPQNIQKLQCFEKVRCPAPTTITQHPPNLNNPPRPLRKHAQRFHRGRNDWLCLGTEHIHVERRLVQHGIHGRCEYQAPAHFQMCLLPTLCVRDVCDVTATPNVPSTPIPRLPLPAKAREWAAGSVGWRSNALHA